MVGYPYLHVPLEMEYVYLQSKTPMYVRVRCPVCGMWTRLDNLNRSHVLFEEMSSYSGGRAKIIHIRKKNLSLRSFWIRKLLNVLKRLGFNVDIPIPYDYESLGEVRYSYAKEEKSYPYAYA